MRKYHFIWMALLSSIIFVSCKSVDEYDIVSPTPKMVVNSLFGQDSLFRVEVTTSADPGNGVGINSLKDASVIIYENGIALQDITLDSAMVKTVINSSEAPEGVLQKIYFYKTEIEQAKVGIPYTVIVSHPDYGSAQSVSIIPRTPRINVLANWDPTPVEVNGKNYLQIKFEIEDDGRTNNFYAIELLAENSTRGIDPFNLTIFSAEEAFTENLYSGSSQTNFGSFYNTADGVFFSDADFQGRKKEIVFYIDEKYFNPEYTVDLRFYTLSEEYYKFVSTYRKQLRNQGDPFAEPVQVYSNISNGYGIFAGYSSVIMNLK